MKKSSQLPLIVQEAYKERQRIFFPLYITHNAMCYPQIDPAKDLDGEGTFAQRLRDHIEFCIEDDEIDHLSDTVII